MNAHVDGSVACTKEMHIVSIATGRRTVHVIMDKGGGREEAFVPKG